MDTREKRYSAATACSVADVKPVTLRAWRNNNGLLTDPANTGWNRFSVVDLCVVRFVACLTRMGFGAEEAVAWSDQAMVTFAILLRGEPFSDMAWISPKAMVYADLQMRVAEYEDRPEVSVFVDLRKIILTVLAELKGLQPQDFAAANGLQSIFDLLASPTESTPEGNAGV